MRKRETVGPIGGTSILDSRRLDCAAFEWAGSQLHTVLLSESHRMLAVVVSILQFAFDVRMQAPCESGRAHDVEAASPRLGIVTVCGCMRCTWIQLSVSNSVTERVILKILPWTANGTANSSLSSPIVAFSPTRKKFADENNKGPSRGCTVFTFRILHVRWDAEALPHAIENFCQKQYPLLDNRGSPRK